MGKKKRGNSKKAVHLGEMIWPNQPNQPEVTADPVDPVDPVDPADPADPEHGS